MNCKTIKLKKDLPKFIVITQAIPLIVNPKPPQINEGLEEKPIKFNYIHSSYIVFILLSFSHRI